MALPPLLSSVIGWLRAGYPEGVPTYDYIPLFALLSRRLSDADVAALAEELASTGDPASAQAVRDAIAGVTNARPLESDVARVSARLAAGGWPLAGPGELAPRD
ncbi:DUF3349 domain-containing protein [Streptacidiphilus sp. PB12-B1b]|uniref:DUF3349 domain-containing protein n=1 Tax=Streptacidiphilus sp. PB12-B1b TaxID=2705012 RepID=UPI0015FBEFE7|nr:DUF3349 domain-containing protein [Streptacidiphilus sp. PB12-B1b]QMU79100.1 DUF3349 domain-containing protein [Streptacidiphilus sp. PB12-B1b]